MIAKGGSWAEAQEFARARAAAAAAKAAGGATG
jgi:hypothetical protein